MVEHDRTTPRSPRGGRFPRRGLANGKVGGVTGRLTAGMSFGVNETVTNTTGTFYEGTVGDIPSDTIDAFGLYRFGLLAYRRPTAAAT